MTDIDDDTPITLKEAARRAFPAGGMTAIKLRRQIDIGNLKGYQIGRTVFTTLRDIRAMLDASTIQPQQQVDWHAKHEPPDPFGRTPEQAQIETSKAALEKVLADLRKPKKPK